MHRTAGSPRLVTPEAVPAWLGVLLADVLCIPGVWYRSAQIAEIVEARPGWNADRVVGLLSEDGTDGPGLPAAVFLTAFSDAEDPRRYCYQDVRCCPLPAVLPGAPISQVIMNLFVKQALAGSEGDAWRDATTDRKSVV